MLHESKIHMSSNSNKPLVSIITVTLNAEKYLDQTIKSVLNQSYKNLEYIIIDGASKDNTINIIKKFESQITTWISEKDNGLYYAMNKGISLAKGEIIGIVNADDFYSNDTVELVVEAYLKNNADIFHGDLSIITNNASIKMTPDIKKMKQQSSIFHPTCFVKKTVYEKIGNFNTIYKISADYDFLLRCLNQNLAFTYIPKVLSNFRPGGMSASCATNIEGYKIMKTHNTGYQNRVIVRGIICYLKTFLKKFINLKK
jgi:glycosyltransferase involved in cell wall biosynthesis